MNTINYNFNKTLLLITLTLSLTIYSFSQECKDFHKSNDCYVYIPPDKDYEIYNQARSAYAVVGKTNIYKVILFGKKDFIVGVCAEAKYYRQIWFRIIDSNTKQVLYDNKDFDYIESFGFTIERTQPLDLEVTIITKDKNPPNTKICLGIQILSAKCQEKGTKSN
jgi:hypothetical protein